MPKHSHPQTPTPAPGSGLINAIPAMRDGRLPINLIDHIPVSEAAEHTSPHDCYGLTQDEWQHLCHAAFENLSTTTTCTVNDVDSILTWCIPLYLDMRGINTP